MPWADSNGQLPSRLRPLWQWKGAVKSSGRPNRLVRTFAKLIWTLPPTYSAGDGWLSDHDPVAKDEVWRFQLHMNREKLSWAFLKANPGANIPSDVGLPPPRIVLVSHTPDLGQPGQQLCYAEPIHPEDVNGGDPDATS